MHRLMTGTAVLCSLALLGGMAPAVAADGSGPRQRIVTNASLPPGINGFGRTILATGPMRTNAGQRARLRVQVRSASGQRIAHKQFRVVRKHGKVLVMADLGRKARVKVTLTADGKGKYPSLRKVRRYIVTPLQEAEEPLPGGNSSTWTTLFKFVGESVAGALIGELVGWGISALFDTDKPVDLQPILNKLDQIQQTLTVISAQIAELQKDLRNATCDIQTSGAAKAVSNIQAFNADLRSMIKNKNTNGKDLDNWVDNAIRSDALRSDIATLDKILMGQGGSGGSVKACATALLDTWVKPLDEAGYYQRVWNYMSYFHQAQLLGLTSLVEAYHYMAAKRAKESGRKMPAPKDITAICVDKRNAQYGDAVQDYCDRAYQVTVDTYWNIVEQTLQAGAAYGWDPMTTNEGRFKDPTIAVQKGTNYVWVLNLNQAPWFREMCGPGPINSADKACTRAMLTAYDGRTPHEWWTMFDQYLQEYQLHPARDDQWQNLLRTATHPGNTISDIMQSVGFPKGTTDKLIVYTGQTYRSASAFPSMKWDAGGDHASKMPLAEPWSGACLFDSNFTVKDKAVWPICGENALPFQTLLDDYQHERYAPSYSINPSAMVKSQGSDQSFYAGSLTGKFEDGYYYPATASDAAPGWLSTRPGEGIAPRKPAYMWPVADLDGRCVTLKLDDAHSYPLPEFNAASARSMCRWSYKAWLQDWLPKPPVKK